MRSMRPKTEHRRRCATQPLPCNISHLNSDIRPGLSVHLNQVHKETLNQVENALPNRQGLEVEIFGMEGMPQEALDQHRNRIIQNFYQAQEDRRVATGNPLPGGAGHARKKLKVETAQELLARFAEFRVRKKAAAAAGGGAMEGVVAANGDAQQYVSAARMVSLALRFVFSDSAAEW